LGLIAISNGFVSDNVQQRQRLLNSRPLPISSRGYRPRDLNVRVVEEDDSDSNQVENSQQSSPSLLESLISNVLPFVDFLPTPGKKEVNPSHSEEQKAKNVSLDVNSDEAKGLLKNLQRYNLDAINIYLISAVRLANHGELDPKVARKYIAKSVLGNCLRWGQRCLAESVKSVGIYEIEVEDLRWGVPTVTSIMPLESPDSVN